MDIDRFVADNQPVWDRLEVLTARSQHLTGAEVRELTRLYQRTTGHLAHAQAHFSDPGVKADLTNRVAVTASVLYSARRLTWKTVARFLSETWPLALWRARWFLVASALAMFAPALAVGLWTAHSHAAVNAIAPAAVREAYVNHDFRTYYSSHPSVEFAAQVYFNNVLVAFVAFAGGIAFGLLTVWVLFTNGLNIGVAAGLFYAAHRPGEFWGLVTPHGLLELTSVTMAGAAGLQLGWALVSPGDRARLRALAEEGRNAVVLALGTGLTLAVSGLIEGFVAGSSLPTSVRVGIGVAVELSFLSWVVVCGRVALRAGRARSRRATGDRRPPG